MFFSRFVDSCAANENAVKDFDFFLQFVQLPPFPTSCPNKTDDEAECWGCNVSMEPAAG